MIQNRMTHGAHDGNRLTAAEKGVYILLQWSNTKE